MNPAEDEVEAAVRCIILKIIQRTEAYDTPESESDAADCMYQSQRRRLSLAEAGGSKQCRDDETNIEDPDLVQAQSLSEAIDFGGGRHGAALVGLKPEHCHQSSMAVQHDAACFDGTQADTHEDAFALKELRDAVNELAEAPAAAAPADDEPETLPPTSRLDADARVGLIYDRGMAEHAGPEGHLENPLRVIKLFEALQDEGLAERCWILPSHSIPGRWGGTNNQAAWANVRVLQASDEELLVAGHSSDHIQAVDGMYRAALADGEELGGDEVACPSWTEVSRDVFCNTSTARAARLAAGCCIKAVQCVLSGQVDRAFAVVRPPGHHAECSRAQGFCFFNNTVAAARAALQHPGVGRVAILDWDVHHGNGIQQMLDQDSSILYISLHRFGKGFYPGTGAAAEVGEGPGSGFTVNVPWEGSGYGGADYIAAFDVLLEPVLQAFGADLLIVAAGFDAVEGDPLGGMMLSPAAYALMTKRLLRYAGGRLVVALEGGYNVRLTAECATEVVRTLLQGTASPMEGRGSYRTKHATPAILKSVAKALAAYWPGTLDDDLVEERWKQLSARLASRSRAQRQQGGAELPARALAGDDGILIFV